MKSVYLELAWKTILSTICVASLGTVAILDRLETFPEDKIYPIVLFLAVIYLHWIAWELFFAFFGVPALVKERIKTEKKRTKSISGFLIAFGYVFITLSTLNQLMSPSFAQAVEMISWSMKLIAAGVIIQMLFTLRELISKIGNEN